ncbi:MAG TPA: sulfotransferase domain-containing protein [Bacteroidia bacterium]|nr:sulfotransferase domain-containing protein [Bacteroidia bacterium]
MIVGAQKAGTTSLKHYLGEHPQLQTHPQKEFSYFADPDEHSGNFERAIKKYFVKPDKHKLFVAKNALLYSSAEGLKKLHHHNSQVKTVCILRHPIERTYSAFLMERNSGSIRDAFDILEDLILHPGKYADDWRYKLLIGMSKYAEHLENLYSIFPKENITVELFENFSKDPAALCRTCFHKLGVNENFIPDVSKKYNETKKVSSYRYARMLKKLLQNENPLKRVARNILPDQTAYGVGEMLRNVNKTRKDYPQMKEQTRRVLLDYFRPYNEKLEKLTGLDLSDWNE